MEDQVKLTEYDKEVAKHLGMPPVIILAIRRGEWGAVKAYAQRRWNADGYKYFKANSNAVERILNEFSKIVKNPIPPSFETKKRIALYVHHIGVGPLIDDIREALAQNPHIRTLNYFMADHDGKIARWSALYNRVFERKHNEAKTKYKGTEEQIMHEIGFAVKKDAPEWVIEAEERKAELIGKQRGSSLTFCEVSELRKIEAQLINHYSRNQREKLAADLHG